jgi:hypothetical protein
MEPRNCAANYSSDLTDGEKVMGRYLLLWLLGIPIPVLILIWMFGGLS